MQVFHLVIPNTKTKKNREFFATCGSIDGLNMAEIFRKYLALRPNHIDYRRFLEMANVLTPCWNKYNWENAKEYCSVS